MLTKALLTVAALGVVSLWYLRSRAPLTVASVARARQARAAGAAVSAQESPNIAERLQHSHAMGVAGGIEQPQAQGAEASLAEPEVPGDASWPATREFLRGA
jgi:hypothetical protein